ncbi:acyltransferase family protein [Halopseudomonas salina]|uniref:Acyltransferase n=1 Tax=Halopseudomonas salina TaxID=1323744 RepID=A0ABQ1PPC9_9GAMM|nr:acyltransferase family protein [Halopseudomonas salina]GGD00781.1 acyltransferase [Halopseudomonas salina]
MSKVLSYRRDIDGLRALAVLPVVLFHLDVALFSGGFIGVDVFFVISGFLITSIIYREVMEGKFSYAHFYERRIRRLFPALIAVLLVSTLVAWFMLLPLDFRLFSEGLAAAVIFLANVHYWGKTDYFDDPVENIPLLHTWSLAVEEQFYILFPPLLILLVRFFPAKLNWILLTCAIASLIDAQNALSSRPESAFYLVHLRAWELLAGALLATGFVPLARSQWLRDGLSVFGLVLIVASIFLLDKDSAFPGLTALPAVTGAALIIYAGMGGRSVVGTLLGWRPLVFIGLLSYSLYLWHWPLFVFVRYYLIEPLNAQQQVVLFVVACGLGWASWRFVENPFRRKSGKGIARKQLFWGAGLITFLIILVSLPGMITRGAAFRLPPEIAAIEAIEKETIPFRRPCFGLSPDQIDGDSDVCTLGVEGQPNFLLWGDSHALSLAHGMDIAAHQEGVSGRFLAKSVCPPVLGTQDFMASDISCKDFNDAVVRYLDRHPSIRNVVLVGVWFIYDKKSDGPPEVGFKAGFERTLDYLKERDIHATVILQVPKIAYEVPAVLARQKLFDNNMEIRTPLSVHLEQGASFKHYIAGLEDTYAFSIVNLDSVFCDEKNCNVALNDKPLYRDSHHLSRLGSELAVDALREMVNDDFASRAN